MEVYLFLLILALIAYKTNNNKIALLLAFLLVVFAGLRADSVGTDTYRYIYRDYYSGAFNLSDAIDNHKHVEFIWNGLYQIIENLGLHPRWILGIVSFLTITFVCISAVIISPSLSLSLFLFLTTYYLYSYNGMRQILAASILMLGFTNLCSKELYLSKTRNFVDKIIKLLKENGVFIALLIVACLVHFSTWIASIFILCIIIKIPKKMLIAGMFASVYLGMFFDASFVSDFILGFQDYDHLLSGGGEGSVDITIIGYIFRGIYIILYTIIVYYSDDSDPKVWRFAQLFIAGVVLQNLLINYSTYVSRISIYLLLTQCLYFPLALNTMKKSHSKMIVTIVLVLYSVIFMRDVLSNSNGVYPYLLY